MTVAIDLRVAKDRFPDLHRMNWTPVYGMMAAHFTREWAQMFDTAGVSRGHKWQELAPSTLIRKAKKGQSTEILQVKGLLRASGRTLRIDEDGLRWGTDIPYAKYHDSDRPRKQKASGGPKLPQRKLLRIIPRDAEFFEARLRGLVESVAVGDEVFE